MIRLLSDNVLLKLDIEEVSSGGIVLVQSMDPKKREHQHARATVIAVGPGTKDYAVDVKPGDRVLVPIQCGDIVRAGVDCAARHLGSWRKWNRNGVDFAKFDTPDLGDEFRICRESEIIGVLV